MLRRLSAALAVLVTAWLGLSLVLYVWPAARSKAPAHADVVVVLSGEPARLPVAERLIRRKVAPVLAISSVQDTPRWRAAKRLCAVGRYLTARVLCFRAVPYSTRGEARAIARLARARGWTHVVVVTSTFHLTRARMLVRRCYHGGLSMIGSPSPWWRLPGEWISETEKLAVQVTVERGC